MDGRPHDDGSGALEDVRAQHTRNPALCILAGPGHAALAERLDALTDVVPALLGALGVEIESAASFNGVLFFPACAQTPGNTVAKRRELT